ncbi:MAG: putative lipid II flippase FtsW [Candidatus Magasanikbacteria bacterium]|nr:putative lipid II flippase FtsW [Candidatus Magasanikbacteria bacterium]
MKQQEAQPDYLLLVYFGVLVVFGLIILSFASVAISVERFNDPNFFLKRQVLFGFLPGLLAFYVCSKFHYTLFKRYAVLFFAVCVILLLLVFVPGLGASFDTGAYSWLRIGSYSFQPSEILKLGLIIFAASILSERGKDLAHFRQGFLPIFAIFSLPIALVVLQPDIGTALILFGVVFGLLFVAKARLSHLGLLFLTGVLGFVIMISVAPYRAARVSTFLHPELDPQGIGYHINQAFLAIGSGGWFGLGLGRSRQKFAYLPEVHADSIFAVMSEEMGFVVSSLTVLFLVFIALRMFNIAKRAPSEFARLSVAGIAIWFMIQSFLNIGAIVGLLPLTGVPLPFISHGGTALMVGMAAMGMVINISKYAQSG